MLFLGQDITGKTLGIIGAGRIGSNVALKMAKGFGMKVLYVNNSDVPELEQEISAKKVSLETLLRESDFVSLHVNYTAENKHLIGEKQLSIMKPTAVLINTSRGPVIDEKALVKALQEQKIFSAGLDVFENEPALEPGLIELPNVTVVPHIASATLWTRNKMAEMASQSIIDALEGKMPKFCVNKDQLKAK
jgi:glyoxylate reductase